LPHRLRHFEEEPAFVATHTSEVLSVLLPDAHTLHLDACYVDTAAAQITLRVHSTQARVPCPHCATPARRIHSRYNRTLADLPWATYRVRLQLRVRKWFCRNRHCRRRIFTERVPTIAAPWARRTLRLAQRLLALGGALGGTAGVHLGHAWDVGVSRNTLLRLLRRQPAPSFPTPRVLGVDDFALRKRHTYGTVLIDLERRQPVALLPDREGDTFAQWLQAHPGVEVITRDRAKAYADSARHGAPQATQVADRFHLVQNLAETLTQIFNRHSPAFQVVNEASSRTPHLRPDGTVVMPVPPSTPPRHAQVQAAHSRSRRLARHEQIWALRGQGWTGQAIAQQLRIGKTTVFRYLRSPTFAERTYKRRGHSILNPYKALLLQHWNQGCHDARQVFHLLQQQGYRGSYATVARYAQRLRQAQGLAPRQPAPTASPLPLVAEPQYGHLTPRGTAWLVLRRPETRRPEDEHQLVQLAAQQAELAEAITLARDFVDLVRTRQPDRLDGWLARATTSAGMTLRRFAHGLRDDYAAVKAGVTVPWSNGPVEGHINRLKLLKRQMFGRAHLDLLGQRFLRTPREREAQGLALQASAQAQTAVQDA
jgi:transposase